jgi:hypothetical protein
MQGTHKMFQWAQKTESEQEGGEASDASDDPIGDLLKSNKAVFGTRNEVLQ